LKSSKKYFHTTQSITPIVSLLSFDKLKWIVSIEEIGEFFRFEAHAVYEIREEQSGLVNNELTSLPVTSKKEAKALWEKFAQLNNITNYEYK
jgi:hypothetical protein